MNFSAENQRKPYNLTILLDFFTKKERENWLLFSLEALFVIRRSRRERMGSLCFYGDPIRLLRSLGMTGARLLRSLGMTGARLLRSLGMTQGHGSYAALG